MTDHRAADDDAAVPHARLAASLLAMTGRHQHVAEQRIRLNTAELRLLWLLNDRPRTLREISETLGLEQSTVNRQVNGALAAGLLRRYREPGRSAQLVAPTDEGRDAFEQDVADALGAVERALVALGEDAGAFLRLLERFVEAYGVEVHALPSRAAPS